MKLEKKYRLSRRKEIKLKASINKIEHRESLEKIYKQ